MRCTQNKGFGSHDTIVRPVESCPTCGQSLPLKVQAEYARTGMFDEVPLYRFEVGGEVYEEFVQHEEWWSGPMLFMAYRRVRDGRLFNTWTEAEIKKETS